jgi:hypothetical protein
MVLVWSSGHAANVVARRADGHVRGAPRLEHLVPFAWMADADRPRLALGVQTRDVQVSTRVDGEVPQVAKLACREIDRHAFGDTTKIEHECTLDRDRLCILVDMHVAVAGVMVDALGKPHDGSGAVFPIETALGHDVADGRIEGTRGDLGHVQRKSDDLEEHRTRGDSNARLPGKAHELTVGIESGTACLDPMKPLHGAIQIRAKQIARFVAVVGAFEDVNRDDRGHDRRRQAVQPAHFAL